MKDFEFYIPTHMYFGAGSLAKMAEIPLPGKKALIVISSGKSVKKNGHLDRLTSYLEVNGSDWLVFDKILPNPIVEHVMEASELAKANGCDYIIGLGGGSAIDSAKSIALMAANPGHYWDYINGGSGKAQPVENQPLPIVAITTTAGTGTEIDPFTVQTNGDEKIGFGVPGTFPAIAIVDPELMLTVPRDLTAFQGFDAFFHAAEGYLSKAANPLSDTLALKVIELIGKSLSDAVNDGENLEARSEVALANSIAGMVECLSKVTSQHAMSHGISALFPKIAHGQALTMLSIAFFGFFAKHVPERTMPIAKALGQEDGDIAMALMNLQKACGVYEMKMSDYGVKPSDLEKMVDNSFETMGRMYAQDRVTLEKPQVMAIFTASYR